LAVVSQSQLRSTTDYLISSLAIADLLIMIFCLPTTLLNNILTEWQLGALFCKMSTWINATTSCASIYTLVAVTADRYLAICHTLKYTLWEVSYTLYVIAGIWIISGSLATPSLYGYDEIYFEYGNQTLCVCASRTNEKLQFVVVNLILAFIVPFMLISVSYTKIFYTVSNHRSLAVDAHIRDERTKLRVATMMLTVIVVFALCWLPLYGEYHIIKDLTRSLIFGEFQKTLFTSKNTQRYEFFWSSIFLIASHSVYVYVWLDLCNPLLGLHIPQLFGTEA
uniref:G_PROTEIN_RECEP_F1_2 domain-containing protein n=1 Tax=Angiostrongylus cantonensis TaxID=6313 RepID=A0A0K0DNC9_ANGCA